MAAAGGLRAANEEGEGEGEVRGDRGVSQESRAADGRDGTSCPKVRSVMDEDEAAMG